MQLHLESGKKSSGLSNSIDRDANDSDQSPTDELEVLEL